MHIPDFSISAIPKILFGAGTSRQLPSLAAQFGNRVLLLTGAHSYTGTQHWPDLQTALDAHGVAWLHDTVAGEPSPALADALASRYRNEGIAVVIGIGGGSVLDAAKAVAGLLHVPNSVMDFLEGVGIPARRCLSSRCRRLQGPAPRRRKMRCCRNRAQAVSRNPSVTKRWCPPMR